MQTNDCLLSQSKCSTLKELTQIALESVPPELISITQKRSLLQFCSQLPVAEGLILELDLASNTSQIDLSFGYAKQHLLTKNKQDSIYQHLSHLTAFDKSSTFLAACFDQDTLLHKQLRIIGFEFDAPMTGLDMSVCTANLFFGFNHKVDHLRSAIPLALRHLFGDSYTQQQHLNNLQRLQSHLPAQSRIDLIGCMLNRDKQPLRVNITGLKRQQIWPLLSHYPELHNARRSIVNCINQAWELSENLIVCLDLGTKTSPRIGFEILPPKGSESKQTYQQILDQLENQALASQEKINALKTFERQISPADTQLNWPVNLLIQSLLQTVSNPSDTLHQNKSSIINLKISHLKLLHTSNGRHELKAYLGISSNWID